MRLHVVSLPHTEVMQQYNQCAYTAKVRKFATMMTERGHEVLLYSSGRNEAKVSEHVQVLSEDEYVKAFERYDWWVNKNWPGVSWNPAEPYWERFNRRVAKEMLPRLQPNDIVCLITGYPHQELVDQIKENSVVEFGIGYNGILNETFHVFESYIWMHAVYGMHGPAEVDGRFYDEVIPNYFDIEEFLPHTKDVDEPYYLFMSRMNRRKGYEIAVETTRRLGAKLIIAGTPTGEEQEFDHVEYTGFADVERRAELLAGATALFCPTLYLEPFGGVVCESLLSGTPVLTTDFGAFPETVRDGNDGYRCHTIGEFEEAAVKAANWPLSHHINVRRDAQDKWGLEPVSRQYETYFNRLEGLKTRGGFYEHWQR